MADEPGFPYTQWLERNQQALTRYTDECSLFNLRPWLDRAGLLVLTGAPLEEALEACHRAALCLRENVALHLYRVPVQKFRTRRLEPLELGLLSRDVTLMRDLAADFGLSLHQVLAGMAEAEVMAEVGTLTGYFRPRAEGQPEPLKPADLAGLGALAYAAALSEVMQGFEDEAGMSLDVFLGALHAAGVAPDPAASTGHPALDRYVTLAFALRAWVSPTPELAVPWTARWLEGEAARRAALQVTEESLAEVLDRTTWGLLALAALRGAPCAEPSDATLAGLLAFMRQSVARRAAEPEGPRELPPEVAAELERRLAALKQVQSVCHETCNTKEDPT
jgi:hypothetical protein